MTFSDIWLPALFGLLWATGVTIGIVRKSVNYLSGIFFVLSAVFFIINSDTALFSQVWPMLLAIPVVCSISALFRSKIKRFHVKCIIFFGLISVEWFLYSFGIAEWWVSLIVTFVIIAAFITFNAISKKPRRKDSEKLPRKAMKEKKEFNE